ncbi:MAG: response regulator transcription factor [Planctomycetaceae bacterium]|nr:response regulator transcription factor [Planctomycetales bacterium]MCB9873417.1 response regulator transcription factor [Planctomycetaceae bacterium]MCB9939076.1 response regulator transcription factor [Planctomycetaceae bacterium]
MPTQTFRSKPVATSHSTVFVVDDDPEFRESVSLLLESVKLKAHVFVSAEDFVANYDRRRGGCLVSDVRMPGMSGLELQKWMLDNEIKLPIILVTGHAEVPMAVEAMRAGAVDFIQKPYSPQQLLERVQQALRQDEQRREEEREDEGTQNLLATLTPREREIMDLLLDGGTSQRIGNRLNLSTKTVDFHRRNMLDKMGVDSIVELAKIVGRRV